MGVTNLELLTGAPPVLAAQGCCYFCKNMSSDRVWIDTGVVIDYEGGIAICGNCARIIAQLVGWVSKDSVAKLRETISTLKKQLAVQKPKADAFDMFMKTMEEVS